MKRIVGVFIAALLVGMAGISWAADTNTLSVGASVLGTCKFASATSSIALGNLDPSGSGNPTGSTNVNFWCTKGQTVTVTHDMGAHEAVADTAPPRLFHATTGAPDIDDWIPYTLTLTPSGTTGLGKTAPIQLAIQVDIQNSDYVDAQVGSYADTVVISINP